MDVYDYLYECYLKEKESTTLIEVDSSLFEEVRKQLSIEAPNDKVKREQYNLRKIFRDLVNLRVCKVFSEAVTKIKFNGCFIPTTTAVGTEEEKKLYTELITILDEYISWVIEGNNKV